MARLIWTPQAKLDIAEVLGYTANRWGKVQARAYGVLIKRAIEDLTADPLVGKSRHETRQGIRAHHIRRPGHPARHILFYRINIMGAVEIVRLLHDAMDFERHIPSET